MGIFRCHVCMPEGSYNPTCITGRHLVHSVPEGAVPNWIYFTIVVQGPYPNLWGLLPVIPIKAS